MLQFQGFTLFPPERLGDQEIDLCPRHVTLGQIQLIMKGGFEGET